MKWQEFPCICLILFVWPWKIVGPSGAGGWMELEVEAEFE